MLAEIFFKCHSLFVLLSSFRLECSTLGHIRSLLKGGHTQDLNTMWRKIPTSPLPKSPRTLCCSMEASFWAKELTVAFNLFHPSSESDLILNWILNKHTIYNCFQKQCESGIKTHWKCNYPYFISQKYKWINGLCRIPDLQSKGRMNTWLSLPHWEQAIT